MKNKNIINLNQIGDRRKMKPNTRTNTHRSIPAARQSPANERKWMKQNGEWRLKNVGPARERTPGDRHAAAY